MLILSSNLDYAMEVLARDALQSVSKRVYGCGNMDHHNLIELVKRVDAVVGLTVTEEAVNASIDLRQRLLPFYRGMPLFVDDPLSIEWMRHYDVHDAKLGHNPAWAAGQDAIDKLPYYEGNRTATSVGEAILFALKDKEMTLEPHGSGQTAFVDGQPFGHHPLVRWAARYGVEVGVPCCVDRNVVVKARKEASAMIRGLFQERELTVDERIDKALGVTTKSSPRPGVRRLELGQVFDPSIHYTSEYYDHCGIEYMRPDGTWAMYHGTALKWGGFEFVAKVVDELAGGAGKGNRTLLDIGCSAGAFVGSMRGLNWWAYGVDLSSEAHGYADAATRPHLLVGNVCKPSGKLAEHAPYNVITSWDLLEHIYTDDVDELLHSVFALLAPGGLFFNVICTRGKGEQDFVSKPGDVVTRETGWALVAGHVNIRKHAWWERAMDHHGFKIRRDLSNRFQVMRAEDPIFRQTASWSARNMLIVQRPNPDCATTQSKEED